jgi:hypothetical protein
MVRRLLREGDARHGAVGTDLAPDDARCLLRAWLSAVELGEGDEWELISHMQADGFSHSDLYRRACRAHERKLRAAVEVAVGAVAGRSEVLAAAEGLFEASSPVSRRSSPRFRQAVRWQAPARRPVLAAGRMASVRAWRSSPTASARRTA